jgi:hypothetical protein
MAAKKDKGFGDIGKGLRKNPALVIGIIVAIIIFFVILSNSQSGAGSSSDGQGLPNGTGGSSYYLVGLGNDYATGGPWDSFFRKYPGSYHSKHHHVTGKSHHDHGKGHGSHGHGSHGHSSHGGHGTTKRKGKTTKTTAHY